jgi:sigma-E factor negative regulatory protein RseB
METMRLVHTADGGREQERLISLNGAQREVVRDNHSVVYILPDSQLVAAKLRSENHSLPLNSENLSQFYQLKILDDERVAARLAKVVLIMPLDNYRYGHRLFLDAEHGLPLKSEVLDDAGDTVSQVMFTQLNVDPEIRITEEEDSEVDVVNRGEFSWVNQVPARRLNKTNGTVQQVSPWGFPTLPEGFRLTVHAQRPATGTRDMVDHFLFSDGLASFSVYIERMTNKKGLSGSSRMGAINVYGRRLGEYQVTAVGEVPERTVREMAVGVTAAKLAQTGD